MARPPFKRPSHFFGIVVSLINSTDSRKTFALMIEAVFSDFHRHAEPLHAGRKRTSEIVNDKLLERLPAIDRHNAFIESLLRF